VMEDYSGISQGYRIVTGSDYLKNFGFGNHTIEESYRNVKRAPVNIGKFCIVGANSVVLPGVTIGEGAMVAACSVVTKDLVPWGIYLGNKKINTRDKDPVLNTYERYLKEGKGKSR
jgi:acetyltransferase-like isoleucine patch superfamily enzyme